MVQKQEQKQRKLIRLNGIFQALPPLDSGAYLEHLEQASLDQLPAEVLVRAYRQLPPGSLASRATLARLFSKDSRNRWTYLGPLCRYLRRIAEGKEYKDSLQASLLKILETLLTNTGASAERAWNAFCRGRAVDARRESHGRSRKNAKGNQQPKLREVSLDDDTTPMFLVAAPEVEHSRTSMQI